jgi:hypothetical protein
MADRPILFSAPMVRALLEGRKTQTRRVAKFISTKGEFFDMRNAHGGTFGLGLGAVRTYGPDYAPFAPGDHLWVKETWRASKVADELKPSQLAGPGLSRIWYEADRDNCDQHGKVRVSIHMPRWASRLTLLVTDVRVERLQDISEADAIAEGIEPIWPEGGRGPNHYSAHVEGAWLNAPTAAGAYQSLWGWINGEGAWEANPWVVAVSFTVELRNIDA